jgi:hypothetical protein
MKAVHTADRPKDDPSETALRRLVDRFDPSVFDVGRPHVRIRWRTATFMTW